MVHKAGSKRFPIVILSVALLLVLLLSSSACTCDPAVWIEFNNQTDYTLSIYIGGAYQDDVSPRQTLRFATMDIWGDDSPPWGDGDFLYLIEAKTKDGEVVYSEEFTWQELDDMDWTIVITPEALPWEVSGGRFYTLDLARAQEEIPFPIVLPSYVPDKRTDAPLPDITGPLKEYQTDDKVKVEILYIVDLGSEIHGIIQIEEVNYTLIPGDPELNPDLEPIEICGKEVIKTEGNYSQGPGVKFYFNQDNIYFVVGVYNFTDEEAVKIVGSILEQLD
jgi:hypothetical protein